jgi:adenylate kinase
MDALILFGPPGSGKGTQAAVLVEREGWAHLATGDLFREALARGDETAQQARALMEAGKLVPDELIAQMVRTHLSEFREGPQPRGMIFDGYPRNPDQVGHLDAILKERGIPLLGVIALKVDDELLVKRLTGRRSCPVCGRGYNLYFDPPKVEGRCDDDGAELTARSDDNETTIRERLKVYYDQTQPVLEAYRERGQLQEIEGGDGPGPVAERIARILEEWAEDRG